MWSVCGWEGQSWAKKAALSRLLEGGLVFFQPTLPSSLPSSHTHTVSTTTLAMGARDLAAHGAIVSRLAAVEELSALNVLCSDKTGTLTLNQMVIQEDCPLYGGAKDGADLLQLAALAARWKDPANDALDTMTLGAADLEALADYEQPVFEPFDASVKRTSAIVQAPNGTCFGVAKGAAASLAALLPKGAATDAVVAEMNADVDAYAARGVRCMAVARTADAPSVDAAKAAPWRLAGLLTFLDPPRPDTKATLDAAMAAGVDIKMITGDSALIARNTAQALGLGDSIMAADDIDWPVLKDGEDLRHAGPQAAGGGRRRPRVSGAQVHFGGSPAPGRVLRRHDRGRRQRRPRPQTRPRRHRGGGRHRRGARGGRHRADAAGAVHDRGRVDDRAQNLQTHRQLCAVPLL